jgi:hypothetical protein
MRALPLLALLFASPSLLAQSTRFRLSDLDLRDPHIWASPIGVCTDFTDTGFAGIAFNPRLQASIQTDTDGNGFLDQSFVLEFLPLDQSAPTNLFAAGQPQCTAPIGTTQCDPIIVPLLPGNATLTSVGQCATFLPGTVRPYTPAVGSATGPCFASVSGSVTLNLGGIPVTLTDAQVAATFVGNPATTLSNGLLRGFLSEAAANSTLIPAEIPVLGGQPLSSVLPGGTGNCAAFSDKDIGPGNVPGWYFYLNFPATRLPDDPFGGGFADGFED